MANPVWEDTKPIEEESNYIPSWDDTVPVSNPFQANKILNDGLLFNATPEERSAITNILSEQEMEMETYIAYASAKHGANFTPEMAQANLAYEYGDDATPQVANAMNRKAAKWDKKAGIKEFSGVIAGSMRDVVSAAGEAIISLESELIGKFAFSKEPEEWKPSKRQIERAGSEEAAREIYSRAREKHFQALDSGEYKEDVATIGKGIGDVIADSKPEWQIESKRILEEELSSGDINFLKQGASLVSLNFGNMVASANVMVGYPVMFSQERKSMADDLRSLGLTAQEYEKASNIYGGVSGAIEYVEQVGRLKSAFGGKKIKGRVASTIISKLSNGAVNVGEEVAQQLLYNLIYNDAVEAHNLTTGDNIPLKDIPDGLVDAAQGSLAMTTVLEALGLSVKGAQKAFSYGDAVRIRKQNTNEEIAQIVQNDPVLSETPERAAMAQEAFENPTQEGTEALNRDIHEPKTETAESEQIASETSQTDQEAKPDPRTMSKEEWVESQDSAIPFTVLRTETVDGIDFYIDKNGDRWTNGFHGSPDFVGDTFDRSFLGRNIGLSRGGFSFSPDKGPAVEYSKMTADETQVYVDKANEIISEIAKRDPDGELVDEFGQEVAFRDYQSGLVDEVTELFDDLETVADVVRPTMPDISDKLLAVKNIQNRDANPKVIEAWIKNPDVVDVHGKKAIIAKSNEQIFQIKTRQQLEAEWEEAQVGATDLQEAMASDKTEPQADQEVATDEGVKTRITVESDNILREEYGIDPQKNPETKENSELLAEAMESNRDINVLLNEIKANPRALNDFEWADIALEKARLSKELKRNKKELQKAMDSGNESDIARLGREKLVLKDELRKFTDIKRPAATETGRSFQALKLTINEEKDLTDYVQDATASKGSMLTEKETDKISDQYDKLDTAREEKKSLDSGQDIDEKIAEVRANIDEKKRTIKADKKKSKTEKQKELEALREIERDQDKMFELIKQLDEQTAKINDPKIKNDPEGYKSTIKILLDIRSKSQWWKDLQESRHPRDKIIVKQLQDTFDSLEAQYKGKFRKLKKPKTEVTTDEISDLRNKIAYIRNQMYLEDKLASINEDIRLMSEGRFDEVGTLKRREREHKIAERKSELEWEIERQNAVLEGMIQRMGSSKLMRFGEEVRASVYSLDSWLLRQGGQSLFSNPITTLDAWTKSVVTRFSGKQYIVWNQIMQSSQSFKDSVELMGMKYNELHGGFKEHQESANAVLAEKVAPIRASNREFTFGINYLRWKLSKDYMNRHPNASQAELEAAGKWIMEMTGRGTLGPLESSARGLTAFFGAPRLAAAQVQGAVNLRHAIEKNPDGTRSINPDLAKEIAVQRAKMFMGFGSMAWLLIAMGWEMGTDPEDPLFMKFRKGDKVIDIAPTWRPSLKYSALLFETAAHNIAGVGEMERTDPIDMSDEITRLLILNKIAPSLSAFFQTVDGQNFHGEDRNLAENLFIAPLPIMVQSIYDMKLKEGRELEEIAWSLQMQYLAAGGGVYEEKDTLLKRRKYNRIKK